MLCNWSPDIYARAYRFAAEAHWNDNIKQTVPGTHLPYLMHLSLVSMEVIAALETAVDVDSDLAIQCALLHDTIEDTETTYDQLVETFGHKVAAGVGALTKDSSIEKEVQMADSLERIRLQPREVWMVKMADRITNLQPPPKQWTEDKISAYKKEAVVIFDTLKDCSPYLADRFIKKMKRYMEKST